MLEECKLLVGRQSRDLNMLPVACIQNSNREMRKIWSRIWKVTIVIQEIKSDFHVQFRNRDYFSKCNECES